MNHLYYGDNLTVLREHIAVESVDLIYLDPRRKKKEKNKIMKKRAFGQVPAPPV